MKFLGTIFILFFLSSSIKAENNTLLASTYYQQLMEEQLKIGSEIFLFKQNVNELNLKILNFQIKKSIKIVDSIPAFNNELEFKNAVISRFKFFLSISENEYKEILALVENPNIDNKEYKQKLQGIFSKISTKSRPLDDIFNLAEENYTKKYGIKIQ